MILINFSHPLTDEHKAQIEKFIDKKIDRELEYKAQFDPQYPFRPQLDELMEKVHLTSEEWQTESILVNLPSLNFIAALVLAEMHGRMGYFPPIIRIRPVPNGQFEFAEVLNLRSVRDEARKERK